VTTQSIAYSERSIGKRALHFVLTIAVALVFGPLIAGLLISGNVIMIGMEQGAFGRDDIRPVAVAIVWGTYVLGGGIAAVAGLLVAVWGLWRKPMLVIVLVATAIGTLVAFPVATPSALDVGIPTEPPGWPMTLGLAVITAAGCWLIARPLLRVA
jgi:hypothetical protein